MRRKIFCRSKDADQPSDDAVAWRRASATYAMADGASTSYAGGPWARDLVRHYVNDPAVGPAWIDAARGRFHARMKPDASDWLAEIAFNRGNHATLLGFTIHPDRIEGFALGDTVLFVDSRTGVSQFPCLGPAEFADDPVLLSSHPRRGAFSDTEDAFDAHRFCLVAPDTGWEGCRIVAMTDALALWVVLGSPEERLQQLCAVSGADAFDALVEQSVASGAMRRDDATLLILEP